MAMFRCFQPEDDGIDIPGVLVPLSQRLSEVRFAVR